MWPDDIIKEPEPFIFLLCQLQSFSVVFLAGCKTAIAVPGYHIQAQPCPLNFDGVKLFHKALKSHPMVKFHWPGLNYMLMIYHKECRESEYLYFGFCVERQTSKKVELLLGKQQQCLLLYCNLQII